MSNNILWKVWLILSGYDEIKEEVRAASDIVDVISNYVSLKKTGRNYMGLCPFHSEKTPSFNVRPDNQFFYCFGCHAGRWCFYFHKQNRKNDF